MNTLNLKGWFELFNVRLYEALIGSQRVHLQFGEAERATRIEAKQSTAVDKVSNKMYFSSLKKIHL